MAVWNQVNSAVLAECWRFDAEYWQSSFLENIASIRSTTDAGLNVNLLKKLVRKVTGSAFYPSFVGYYGNEGLPFLRVADLGDLFLKSENMVRIASSVIRSHRQVSTIEPGDLVVAKGGSIGCVCIVTDDFGESAVCRDVIAVRSDGDLLDPYYLAVFLNTRFGKLQLERNKSQQVQAHLTFPAVERMEVAYPAPNEQARVRAMVSAAHEAASASIRSYAEAQELLNVELGLDKLTLKKPVGYIAQLSSIEVSRRFDPEHYFPTFSAFCARLPASVTLAPLSKHLQFCQRGNQPVYARTGLPVINSKHVQPNRVTMEGNRFALANPIDDLQIRGGDTLINGTGRGTIGRAAPYLNDTPAVADNHVTILRSSSLDPAYLSLYLNSAAGQMQVEMHQRGTSGQLELYPFDIRKFLVWPAPVELQRELRDLYDKATTSKQESKRLLKQAKTRVEQLIEAAVQP